MLRPYFKAATDTGVMGGVGKDTMGKIRIAIVGVGNCASSLLQGIEFYRAHDPRESAGVLHPEVGGYRIEDLRVVAAFDVDRRKVGYPIEEAEGIKTQWQRSVLLVLAITLHNIPEGLAVGVAFGAAAAGLPAASLAGAIALALGIGLQNFPEGTAVSVPLRREGMGRLKSFWYGQLSGVVEPVAGVLGAAAVLAVRPILPYALAFAAGAMIYVVVEELIPESQLEKNTHIATWGAMLGFAVMMTLDVALG